MSVFKKLAGQTALYGLPTIIGRILNYFLVPLHTALFDPNKFSEITELYSYVAFLMIFLTYGMETAYFRFINKEGESPSKIFGSSIISLFISSMSFMIFGLFFAERIAHLIHYQEHVEYIQWFVLIVGFDALAALPLAKLRAEDKAKKFALVTSVNIGSIVLFQLLFFFANPYYSSEVGVGYVFIANLIASSIRLLMLGKEFFSEKWEWDGKLFSEMLKYGFPIFLYSLCIVTNEHFDKVLLKWLLAKNVGFEEAKRLLGVYGACYKIPMLMSIFVQAYRYAAEPFFFSQEKENNSKEVYSRLMTYFIIGGMLVFLGVNLYIDLVKYFIPNQKFWEGLGIVPIILIANVCSGVYYNLSIWYKLTDRTTYGALLGLLGAVITVVLNILLIPKFGYMGSAWATLCCYGTMMLSSYFLGRKYYPVPYELGRISFYVLLAGFLFFIDQQLGLVLSLQKLLINTALIGLFGLTIFFLERGKKVVP